MDSRPHDSTDYPLALPSGALLGGRYEIRDIIGGSSTFAITYLVDDTAAPGGSAVVKELLPRALAGRAADGIRVRAHSADDRRTFDRCLQRFMRECEAVGGSSHHGLPRVRMQFAANDTAYAVMDAVDGIPLTTLVGGTGSGMSLNDAVAIVCGVLAALDALHAEGIVHGFVTPDNILIASDLQPVLLGLGTTRHVAGAARDPVAGYAPIEQYASREVGPWTDVYASGAVLHYLLTGSPPPSAIERAAGRTLAISGTGTNAVPSAVARAMAAALAPLPDGRPYSAEELRRRLTAAVEATATPTAAPRGMGVVMPTPGGLRAEGSALPAVPEFSPEELAQLESATDEDAPTWGSRIRRLLSPMLAGAAAGLAMLVLLGITLRGAVGRAEAEMPLDTGVALAFPPAPAVGRAPAPATWTPPSRDILNPPTAMGGDPLAALRRVAANTAAVTQSGWMRPERPPAAAPPETASSPRPVSRAESPALELPRVRFAPLTMPRSDHEVVVPFALTSELREQLEQGNVRAQYGDYGGAQRLFTAALSQMTELERRYPGAGALAAIRRDAEQASARARAACVAENTVLRERNAPLLPCG